MFRKHCTKYIRTFREKITDSYRTCNRLKQWNNIGVSYHLSRRFVKCKFQSDTDRTLTAHRFSVNSSGYVKINNRIVRTVTEMVNRLTRDLFKIMRVLSRYAYTELPTDELYTRLDQSLHFSCISFRCTTIKSLRGATWRMCPRIYPFSLKFVASLIFAFGTFGSVVVVV